MISTTLTKTGGGGGGVALFYNKGLQVSFQEIET